MIPLAKIFVSFGFAYVCLCNIKCDAQATNEIKPGQCPYTTSAHCDFKCNLDSSCDGDRKCCSNGCGTECMKPINFTMCQHMRTVAQHHVAHFHTENKFVPECKEDGSYEDKQCDLQKDECWCVDFRGFEISQTRTKLSDELDCSNKSYSGNCPLYKCQKDCEYGFELNQNGCRTCACKDPCASIKCEDQTRPCGYLKVQSRGWPCPPLPLCLPPEDNPCPHKKPLRTNNLTVLCDADAPCPFTHFCRSSLHSNRGFCCRQRGKCPSPHCNLPCEHGCAYDDDDCPKNECHEPCKNTTCPPQTTCKVVTVKCIRAPCLPIAVCKRIMLKLNTSEN